MGDGSWAPIRVHSWQAYIPTIGDLRDCFLGTLPRMVGNPTALSRNPLPPNESPIPFPSSIGRRCTGAGHGCRPPHMTPCTEPRRPVLGGPGRDKRPSCVHGSATRPGALRRPGHHPSAWVCVWGVGLAAPSCSEAWDLSPEGFLDVLGDSLAPTAPGSIWVGSWDVVPPPQPGLRGLHG